MPRPRLGEEARDRRLVVRCTASEEARVKSAAAAAGMKQSDYLRSRVFLTSARLLERTEPKARRSRAPLRPCGCEQGLEHSCGITASDSSTSSEAPKEEPRPELHRCPHFDGCGFEAASAKARCPVHGRAVLP